MQFSTIFSTLLLAASAAANTVTFKSVDSTSRKVVFTPSPGHSKLETKTVGGGETVVVDFPQGWEGNWYAVCSGKEDKPGMLGEVLFNGWNGLTYFDVSAIVTPDDHDGVYEMYPAEAQKPTSGCKSFPCNNAYYLPDDVQTKTTTETDLICTLGRESS